MDNAAGLHIVDVQFPFVVAAYGLDGNVLVPQVMGDLYVNPQPQDLTPDFPFNWQFQPENGNSTHYPGGIIAQFLAYYNDRAGLYLACDDTEGRVKLIKAMHREPGVRLGIAHVGDWPQGARTLEYDVLVGSFTGDWYAAADLYRDWSLQQHWATPLHRREDVPAWLDRTARDADVIDDAFQFAGRHVAPDGALDFVAEARGLLDAEAGARPDVHLHLAGIDAGKEVLPQPRNQKGRGQADRQEGRQKDGRMIHRRAEHLRISGAKRPEAAFKAMLEGGKDVPPGALVALLAVASLGGQQELGQRRDQRAR